MNIVPFVCLLVVCGAMGVINTIFYKLSGWKAVVVRGLTVVSLLVFSLVTSNLRALTNAFSLFIAIALSVLLLAEVIYVSMNDDEKLKPVVNGVFFGLTNILFALSVMAIAEFSVLALLGGVFAGIGIGLIVCAIRKEKALKVILMNIFTFACVGLLIGLGVNALIVSQHTVSAILMFAAGIFMLTQRMLVVCGKGKIAGYLGSALSSLALILLTISIYFY